MIQATVGSAGPDAPGYRHEAAVYAGIDGFLRVVVPFVRDGVTAGEPVLVVVDARRSSPCARRSARTPSVRASQLCDLVQIRSGAEGCSVRVRVDRRG